MPHDVFLTVERVGDVVVRGLRRVQVLQTRLLLCIVVHVLFIGSDFYSFACSLIYLES